MVRGIQALHKQGILHRDIKPGMLNRAEIDLLKKSNAHTIANFCLERHADGSETENVKCFIIDFGLSRRFLSGNGRVREVGLRCHTIVYQLKYL